MVITTINASAAPNETWKQAVIVYNSNSSSQQISLPSGSGTRYLASLGQTIEPSGTTAAGVAGSNSTPTVPAQGISIFYQ